MIVRMPWTKLVPKQQDELHRILNRISDNQSYVFRGQESTQWDHLMPSLHRMLGQDRTLGEQAMLEAEGIAAFRRHARSLLEPSELSYFDRILDGLTLMQHYGAPTRFLDWTLSPWVAAYFAGADRNQDDRVIWAFNHAELLKINSSRRGKTPPRSRSSELAKFKALLSATTVEDWADAALQPCRANQHLQLSIRESADERAAIAVHDLRHAGRKPRRNPRAPTPRENPTR